VPKEYISPDGVLKLVFVRDDDDSTVGFDGYPWHTHGDVIAGELQLLGDPAVPAQTAAANFVRDILEGRVPISVVRVNGRITDVSARYLPEKEDPYRPANETLEVRNWDGESWLKRGR